MDTTNWHLVTELADETILVQRPPRGALTKGDALLFAAWLVMLAEDEKGQFEDVLEAVRDAGC